MKAQTWKSLFMSAVLATMVTSCGQNPHTTPEESGGRPSSSGSTTSKNSEAIKTKTSEADEVATEADLMAFQESLDKQAKAELDEKLAKDAAAQAARDALAKAQAEKLAAEKALADAKIEADKKKAQAEIAKAKADAAKARKEKRAREEQIIRAEKRRATQARKEAEAAKAEADRIVAEAARAAELLVSQRREAYRKEKKRIWEEALAELRQAKEEAEGRLTTEEGDELKNKLEQAEEKLAEAAEELRQAREAEERRLAELEKQKEEEERRRREEAERLAAEEAKLNQNLEFLASNLTNAEKNNYVKRKWVNENIVFPYRTEWHNKYNIIWTTNLGSGNKTIKVDGEELKYNENKQVVFKFKLKLAKKENVEKIKDVKIIFPRMRKISRGKRTETTELICIGNLKICSGELFIDASWRKRMNKHFWSKDPRGQIRNKKFVENFLEAAVATEAKIRNKKVSVLEILPEEGTPGIAYSLKDLFDLNDETLTEMLYKDGNESELFFTVADDLYLGEIDEDIKLEVSYKLKKLEESEEE